MRERGSSCGGADERPRGHGFDHSGVGRLVTCTVHLDYWQLMISSKMDRTFNFKPGRAIAMLTILDNKENNRSNSMDNVSTF